MYKCRILNKHVSQKMKFNICNIFTPNIGLHGDQSVLRSNYANLQNSADDVKRKAWLQIKNSHNLLTCSHIALMHSLVLGKSWPLFQAVHCFLFSRTKSILVAS